MIMDEDSEPSDWNDNRVGSSSSSSSSSLLLSRLPSFFLSSSALGLTLLLSPPRPVTATAAREGIGLIVLLWLTAALMNENSSSSFSRDDDDISSVASIYVHGLFFGTFVSMSANLWFLSSSSMFINPRRRYLGCLFRIVLRAVNWGIWVVLLLDVVLTTASSSSSLLVHRYHFVIFIGVSLSYASYQWDRHRRKALQRDLIGLPLVTSQDDFITSTANNTSSCRSNNNGQQLSSQQSSRRPQDHDKEWYKWNASESLQWMLSILSNQNDPHSHHYQYSHCNHHHHHHNYHEILLHALGPEGLTCRQLMGLSPAELQQMTHLPAGLVLQLLEQVQQLQEQSPCPPNLRPRYSCMLNNNNTFTGQPLLQQPATTRFASRSNEDNGNEDHETSWLDRYDAEYSQSNNNNNSSTTNAWSGRRNNNNNHPTTMDETSMLAITDQANTLMKDRFGLELPDIRTQQPQEHDDRPQQSASETLRDGFAVPSNDAAADIHTRPSRDNLATASSTTSSSSSSSSSTTTTITPTQPSMPKNDPLSSLPPDFLANMPPHIAAIAQRKPDLVRKILESKTASQHKQHTITMPSEPSVATVNFAHNPRTNKRLQPSLKPSPMHGMPPILEQPNDSSSPVQQQQQQQQQQQEDSIGEDHYYSLNDANEKEEDDDDDNNHATSGEEDEEEEEGTERTELLRQRRKKTPPSVYQSIWHY